MAEMARDGINPIERKGKEKSKNEKEGGVCEREGLLYNGVWGHRKREPEWVSG